MADELAVRETAIPGFFEIDLVVHGDNRGWFKENYQKAKMEALGLPHFEIVQNNISFNAERGVTRGLHAEPWEKFISVANGRSFWCLGGPAQRRQFRQGVDAGNHAGKSLFRAPRRGQRLPNSGGQRDLYLSGQRALVAGRQVHRRQPV